MKWGYALVWPHQFESGEDDVWVARLQALSRYGLSWMHGSVQEIAQSDPARQDRIAGMLADLGLGIVPHLRGGFFGDPTDVVKKNLSDQVDLLEEWIPKLRCPIVQTGVASTHRFADQPCLAEQMDRLAEVLREPARRLAGLGCPLAIENHGDYYVDDLVGLCQRVPGLGIFLDTGNTYLIGEQPLPAFRAAAPYVKGGHFKDHRVRPVPDANPIHFEVGPAVLGEGHVPLRECWEVLKAGTPELDRCGWLIELIPPSFAGNDPVEAFEKSVAFVKGLA